jgi:hypothetical protein
MPQKNFGSTLPLLRKFKKTIREKKTIFGKKKPVVGKIKPLFLGGADRPPSPK